MKDIPGHDCLLNWLNFPVSSLASAGIAATGKFHCALFQTHLLRLRPRVLLAICKPSWNHGSEGEIGPVRPQNCLFYYRPKNCAACWGSCEGSGSSQPREVTGWAPTPPAPRPEARKPHVLSVSEGSQRNGFTSRDESLEHPSGHWEVWIQTLAMNGGCRGMLDEVGLRQHWSSDPIRGDCNMACLWNKGFVQLWKRLLGWEPQTEAPPGNPLQGARGLERSTAFLLPMSCFSHWGSLTIQEGT